MGPSVKPQQQLDPMTGELQGSGDIDPSLLIIDRTQTPKSLPTTPLVFGHTFADHMLSIPWTATTGWQPPRIHPYGPLSLDPSCSVFHYAYTLFEGLKAYKDKNGKVRLFRPDKNMERMNNSASRLAFPQFTGENLISLIKTLISIDKHLIPSLPGHSLYIRPTMIGTTAALGVAPATEVLLFVICSPVGPYYRTGFKPVSLLVSDKYVRAWPGGTGSYKLGLNYAPGVLPAIEAAKDGHQQILWLGEGENGERELTEVGTMNLFVVFENEEGKTELNTAPIKDVVLPGVTRDSVLSLARWHADPTNHLKIKDLPEDLVVSEKPMTMNRLLQLAESGKLKEMFGSGTAAIVSSVNAIEYQGRTIKVPIGEDGLGNISRVMLREIVGRQLGEIESDWSVIVD